MVVLLDNFIWNSGVLLFFAYIISLIIFSIYFIKKARKTSIEMERRDLYGYCIAFFYLIIGITYCIRLYFMFFLPPDRIVFVFNLVSTERIDPTIRLFWQFHMSVAFLGISILMIGVESQVYTKFHYVISAITLIFTPILVLVPYDLAHTLYLLPMGTPIVIILIYIYVGVENPGLRKNAFAIVIGWLIFVLGIVLNSTTMRKMFNLGAFTTFHLGDFSTDPYGTMAILYELFELNGVIFYVYNILSSESGAIVPAILAPISLTTGFLIQAAGYSRKFD
ncbi:MAG: hypothetical protein HWN67_06740 [Candidatus Helarchaeota archaeon]|nr:hypothetical protein [Candidatus Helarchaeota archaeon]